MSGGFSLGGAKSDNKSSGSMNQNVWGPQGEALEQLYANVSSLFNQSLPGMMGQVTQSQDYMNQVNDQALNSWRDQLMGGAYGGMDLANQLSSSLGQSLNSPTNTQQINNMIMGGSGNNYADAMRNQYIQDANQAQNNMLANLDARAAASGMSGGSRHGVATAMGMRDINKNLQSNLAQVGYNTFDKDLDRKLQIAKQADQGTLARQQMLSGMLGNQNTTMQNALAGSSGLQNLGMGNFASYMMPWQMAGQYASTIGGPTVLSQGSAGSHGQGKGIQTGAQGSFKGAM